MVIFCPAETIEKNMSERNMHVFNAWELMEDTNQGCIFIVVAALLHVSPIHSDIAQPYIMA